MSEVVFHVRVISHFSNLIRAVCVPDPSPDVVCRVYIQHPPPMFSLLRAPLCLLLAGSLDRESYSASGKRRLNMVWWGMWENSRVHLYIQLASLPVDHPDLWEPGQGAPLSPHLPATPCLLLPPILPFSPSCCTSSASLFSLAGPCPRIAQQVPSENRAGDVGRVKLSLFFLLCISLSLSLFFSLLQNHSFVAESN